MGLWMMLDQEGHQNHNDDTKGESYECEFAGKPLAQTDRLRRRDILHLAQESASQSGIPIHVHLSASMATKSIDVN